MIKLNTIYETKDDYFIVIIRCPKLKCYLVYRSVWLHNLEDFDYLLNECNPLFVSDKLHDVRYYVRKIIDGEDYYG